MRLIGFPKKDNSYKKDIIFFFLLRFIESLGKHIKTTLIHIFSQHKPNLHTGSHD